MSGKEDNRIIRQVQGQCYPILEKIIKSSSKYSLPINYFYLGLNWNQIKNCDGFTSNKKPLIQSSNENS